jgi:purine-binding chemotaxis protein CheW
MPDTSPTPAGKTPIDWGEVRARLERSTARAEANAGAGAEAAAAILARRARELARPEASGGAAPGTLDVVAFELEGQTFALEAADVKETVILRDLTRLPGLPATIRGVVNVRSRVLAAVDLRALLHLPAAAAARDEKLLIVGCDGGEFGVLTDRVIGLRSLARVRPRDVPGLNDKYLRGLADDGTVVLALAALLPDLVVDGGPDG